MGFFDIGNILTLIIVGVILAVYRQMDQGNRSLEKVKKFADKMKDEIGGYVDNRTQDLKNLSIEIDVHQKAAKEVLKRITAIESGLKDKTGEIEMIFQRVSAYDKALDELVKMTGRVEENLGRLHKESEFVDKVGKKVMDVTGSLTRLENDLGSIRQEFQKHNLKALDLVRKEITRKTQSDIQKAEETMGIVSSQVEEFSDFIGTLTAKKDDLERDMVASLQNMNRDIVRDIDASGNRIHEELMDVWEKQQKDFFQAIEKKVSEGFARGSELQSGFNTLLSETRQAFVSYEDKIKNSRSVLDKNASEVLASAKERLKGIQTEGFSVIDHISDELAGRLKALRETEDKKGGMVIQDLRRLHEELKQAVGKTDVLITQKLEEFQEHAGRIEHAYEEHLKTVAERGKNFEDDIFAKLREHIEKKAEETEKSLISAISEVRSNIEEKKQEFVVFFGDTRSEITVWKTGVQKKLDDSMAEYEALAGDFRMRIGKSLSELDKQSKTFMKDQESKYSGLSHGLKSAISEFDVQIKKRVADFSVLIGQKFSQLDNRLVEYEEGLGYKFTRIEEIGNDIDSLEENLQTSISRISGKIHGDFEKFEKELAKERQTEKERAGADLKAIHNSINEIEEELNGLKKRAYDSVSEKLQVFEDEFFEDLRTRDETMNTQIETWMTGLDSRIEKYASDGETKRDELESRYTQDMEKRLDTLNAIFQERVAGFEDSLAGFERTLARRFEQSDLGIQEAEAVMKKEIASLQKDAYEEFAKRFRNHAETVDGDLKEYTKKLESEIVRLDEHIEGGRKENLSILDSVRTDVTLWQTQVLKQIKDAENGVRESIADLRGTAFETVAAIKEDFISQREDLILNTQEERARLKSELKDVSETILSLQEDLRRRSDEALMEFSKESESSLLDYQKKGRELQMDMEVRTKDFRTGVSDVREKLEVVQARLMGKIDDEVKVLGINLAEIDKKQKAFIAQTRVFERADQLKESLQASIDELKTELSRVIELAKEVRDSEKEFDKILKVGESASGKMNKFLAEKRRIDAMEEDFARLLNLSQTIDVKLSQMTATHDTLQQIQAELLHLNELEEDVAGKYARLESKAKILETTTTGVDKNFSVISDMSKELKLIRDEMNRIPRDISAIEQRITVLSKNREIAETTIDKLSGLDTVLADIEKRIDAMQEARQWLARTETRLEDVAKQAQEQVKLLGSIMKEGAKRAKGKEGLDTRDVVIRLAREGWAIEEIARTTQLSRSEVELILELVPKK